MGVPVVGYLPRDTTLSLPERHLGLIPTTEPGMWKAWLKLVKSQMEATVDLDRVLNIARTAPPLQIPEESSYGPAACSHAVIAVARDAAFSFQYQDNLDLLTAAGAELAFFSPLVDRNLPSGTQGVYLCGGFPEIYAAELGANLAMRDSLRAAHQAGLPIYAECGGLMYLTQEIVDQESVRHPMVGILPGRSAMAGHLTLGYRQVRARSDSWLWRAGEIVRGHEFHYSTWDNAGMNVTPVYDVLPMQTVEAERPEGALLGSLLASYVHLHFLAHPELAARFVLAASAASPVSMELAAA